MVVATRRRSSPYEPAKDHQSRHEADEIEVIQIVRLIEQEQQVKSRNVASAAIR